jgi:hypothetical protein
MWGGYSDPAIFLYRFQKVDRDVRQEDLPTLPIRAKSRRRHLMMMKGSNDGVYFKSILWICTYLSFDVRYCVSPHHAGQQRFGAFFICTQETVEED